MKILIMLLALALMVATAEVRCAEAALPQESVYQLGDSFSDHNGQDFALASRRGKPQLVAMFYTSCRYVCPLIIDSAKAVEHSLDADQRQHLQVLLISMDPDRDDVAALKATAQARRLDSSRWTLARTSRDGVRRVAALLGVRYRALADGEFNHTSALVLLDDDGRVLARTEKLGTAPDPAFMQQVRAALGSQHATAPDAGSAPD